VRHSRGMALNPEQHLQIAAVYERAASNHTVPPPHRKAFARKAELFRMLARLGLKGKMVEMPQQPAPAILTPVNPVKAAPMASLAHHLFGWQRRR
jgi:hypothetical protein